MEGNREIKSNEKTREKKWKKMEKQKIMGKKRDKYKQSLINNREKLIKKKTDKKWKKNGKIKSNGKTREKKWKKIEKQKIMEKKRQI